MSFCRGFNERRNRVCNRQKSLSNDWVRNDLGLLQQLISNLDFPCPAGSEQDVSGKTGWKDDWARVEG